MSKIEPWKSISRQQVFKKYSRTVDKVMFRLPDGSESDFYILSEAPAVCTLAFTSDKQVVLVRQYRPGPEQILNELPGGFIDKDEDPMVAARREFKEETGYEGDFTFVGTCLDSAYSNMERRCFIAQNCKKIEEPQSTKTEKTEVILLSLEEFRALLKSGKMTDVEVGYLGLDYLGLL